MPDYVAAYLYINDRLHNELAPNLYYHSPDHTLVDVVPAAERLAQMEGISFNDALLLKTAALYHDMGYIEAYERNEPIAARIAGDTLERFDYSPTQISFIQDLIMVTQLPQQPRNKMEEIMCDADLDALGRDDFFITSQKLRLERIRYGQNIPVLDWYKLQLDFLQAHQYFTASAHALHDAMKQQNLRELKQLLGQQNAVH